MAEHLSLTGKLVNAGKLAAGTAGAAYNAVRSGADPRELEASFDKSFAPARELARDRVVTAREKLGSSATTTALVAVLEKRYLRDVTGSGAVVGGAAAMPGVGTIAGLAAAVGDTGVFMTATMVHVFAVLEVMRPGELTLEQERALVLTVLMGGVSATGVKKLAKQAGITTSGGGLIKSLQGLALRKFTDSMRKRIFRRFTAKQATAFVGKLLPFGIGAAVGGYTNRSLGKTMIDATKESIAAA
ncbi:hypothetical protein J2S49_001360 [Arcanobacterium wilhelmae]|uniref:EcsC protein family protein n=1 Tax=Arcanobacterium wilhelmae TaxID=1803177 RepID=A0ABT9NC28_9ACTO|nr:hypothetical protein [Arcanobacterium wilhelmae]MDP9801284.1 hypothetical protein [Arcanobacterium wilhelmae]WFN90630.1 hypothetical protein P8A24_01875 [Arcanobacterium wilhelmae]